MSMEYIQTYYKVPAKRGMRVKAYGKPGVILGSSDAHLIIRIDGEKNGLPYHPTDEIEYLNEFAEWE